MSINDIRFKATRPQEIARVAFIAAAVIGMAIATLSPHQAQAANDTAPDTKANNPTSAVAGNPSASDLMSPVGIWRTIDDTTHKPKALIQIERNAEGVLSGKILTGLGASHSPGSRCTACVDDRKNQPMQGLTIIRDMKQNGDEWEGGNILDPENGKTYHCRIRVEDGGDKLIVRGYLGVPLIGRSQTWIRQRDAAAAHTAAQTGLLDR